MEDVIQTYLLPYDPSCPVVCFDEACKQLFGEVRTPRRRRVEFPTKSGHGVKLYSVCSYSAGDTYPSAECRRRVL